MTNASRILIVDDDDATLYVKGRVLQQSGHSIRTASRGREALAAVAAEAPDLVLLDVKLPDMSGIEVCRQIKGSMPHVVVLQTSAAFTGVADRTRALAGGADSYLVEPIEPDELTAIVNALLRMRAAEQELRKLNDHLERLVADRTQELAEANQRLAAEAADRHKAEAALWHTQKLDIIGRLTGGVAHDFNNLLMVISGNLELIRDELDGPGPSQERLRRLLDVAEGATGRGGKMAQQLLAFARRSTLAAEVVRIDDLVSSWEDLLRRAAGEPYSLTIASAPELWRCRIDPNQLEAAVINLVVNARDAMPDGGAIRIAADNVLVGVDEEGVAPGAYVRIIVADVGYGMTQEVMQRAFEPFFTTKRIGKGSGLGLSQVYGFVKQSGGHVRIDSTCGKGTTVSLYLPRVTASAAAVETTDTDAEQKGEPDMTVLLVEDNEDVRDVAVIMMNSIGYNVVSAANGAEALELIKGTCPVDLLVSDVVMPGIDGLELVRRARALRPGLPILMMSGYPGVLGELRDTGAFPLLRKPFRRQEVVRKIREALQAG